MNEVESVTVPETVPPREEFNYSVEICCDAGDIPEEVGECDEVPVEVRLEESVFTGVLGLWAFPFLNTFFADKVQDLETGTVDLDGGECEVLDGTTEVETPGKYRFIVEVKHEIRKDIQVEVKEDGTSSS